jgi:hypothetical protein
MKVKCPLFLSVLVVFPSTMHAQNSPNMGVVVQSTDANSGASVTTVHLLNISNKEVTAFNLSVQQTLPDGKTFKPSANTEDMLGAYLLKGKAFSPNSTFDVQMGKILVQFPKPVDEKLVVDVVIYADGTAQVQNQDRFKDIMDQRTAHFRTLERVDDAIEKVLTDPATEHPTASVVARLKAVLEDDQKKADTDNKAVIQGNGSSPGEAQLESQIRNFTRLVNRNQEAPLAEMLQHNKTELAKLAPHVHVTEIQ